MTSAAQAAREIPKEISVHKGRKIQAALCVERPPLVVVQPDFKVKWEAFKSAWMARTSNDLTIDDELVFMKFYFHFLQDTRKRGLAGGAPSSQQLDESSAALVDGDGGGLDSLLSQQGIDGLAFPEHGQKTVRKRRKARAKITKVDDADLRSHQRLASQVLFLLVRYGGASKWTFPKRSRVHGQPMIEVLDHLMDDQLGFSDLPPYIVGSCPFSYRKLDRASEDDGIIGRKVFYYRARITGAYAAMELPDDSPVDDFAWCSREELRSMLGEGEWCAVRDCLPLDCAA